MKIIKVIGKFIRKLKRIFTRPDKRVGNGRFLYTDTRYISKSGGDIIVGPVPIPVGDELQCTMFKGNDCTMIAMCIEEKILFIIPWHYYEYIVKLDNSEINFNSYTAEDVLSLMNDAVNWNKYDKLYPDKSVTGDTFEFVRMSDALLTHTYSIENGDYLVLKRTNLPFKLRIS